jgi:haloalkane dehalogenase
MRLRAQFGLMLTVLLGSGALALEAEPVVLTTLNGVKFVRTPDSRFENLPEWPYAAKYVEIDGLRQAYVDEGSADADPILLLHGQPSWSYLHRKMIPVLVKAGHRVIAMDHLGLGRSDKPIEVSSYSYLGHVERLNQFIQALKLQHITLFVQDWGSLIGLKVAGENPDWFDRIVVGDGTLPVIPLGLQPMSPVKDPEKLNDKLSLPFGMIPDQQVTFYGADGKLLATVDQKARFEEWMEYAMTGASFHPAEVIEALTWFPLSAEVKAAYDAPFPSRIYMAGIRAFPSLVNQLPGATVDAWVGLGQYKKPFLTIWASNDPGQLGQPQTAQTLINYVPGAKGQPHVRLPEASHFLQDDQGPEIARRLNEFIANTPRQAVDP